MLCACSSWRNGAFVLLEGSLLREGSRGEWPKGHVPGIGLQAGPPVKFHRRPACSVQTSALSLRNVNSGSQILLPLEVAPEGQRSRGERPSPVARTGELRMSRGEGERKTGLEGEAQDPDDWCWGVSCQPKNHPKRQPACMAQWVGVNLRTRWSWFHSQ